MWEIILNNKIQTAKLSIFSNTFLIILKVIVSIITGSVSIFSEAIHSSVDLLASLITFISVKISDKPADALHLKADVYTSLGVAIGLLLIWITKLNVLDPIIAILVSCFIIKESIELFMNAFSPLLDAKLSDTEVDSIQNLINEYNSVYCNFHNLRTRKAGSKRYIDLHLVMPKHLTVEQAYALSSQIENDIEKLLDNTEVLIHLESCKNECSCCDNFIDSICIKKSTHS